MFPICWLSFVHLVLTPYIPRQKVRKEKNLLSSDGTAEEEMEEVWFLLGFSVFCLCLFWHVSLAWCNCSPLAPSKFSATYSYVFLNVLLECHFGTSIGCCWSSVWKTSTSCRGTSVELQICDSVLLNIPHTDIQLIPDKRDSTGTKAFYRPIVFPNEFWHLRSHYIQINETTPSLPVRITYQPMSYMKFQIFASMTHGFNEAAKQQGQGSGAELDEVKRMLLETNPWFLGLTGLVSLLHVV